MGTVVWTCGLPSQLSVTVDATVPPLNALTLMRIRGVSNVNPALVGPSPLKLALFVVKSCHGPERSQLPVPQSITPAGYSPFSGVLAVRSLKWTVNCPCGPPDPHDALPAGRPSVAPPMSPRPHTEARRTR